MKATILIAVLDSHEVFRRQMVHFAKMPLPEDMEIVIVDDGSNPPLEYYDESLKLTIHRTNDFRPWTQPLARNKGAQIARGEYLICTDIDHIITKPVLDLVRTTDYDVIRFKRYFGVLDANGDFTDDLQVLASYGVPMDRLQQGTRISAHGNSYIIKRDLFLRLGGSQQKDHYPNQDEVKLKRQLKRLHESGQISIIPDDDRPPIYMIPNGRFCGDKDYNPFGLFHSLKRG